MISFSVYSENKYDTVSILQPVMSQQYSQKLPAQEHQIINSEDRSELETESGAGDYDARFQVILKLFTSEGRRRDIRKTPSSSWSSSTYALVIKNKDDRYSVDDPQSDAHSDSEDSPYDEESDVDQYPELKWLDYVSGAVTFQRDSHSSPEKIGWCKASLINKTRVAGCFWEIMGDLNDPETDIAFELFDRFGRLQPCYKIHPFKKGSGVWGDEVDDGDILLIQYLRVLPQYRRLGVGSKLVRAILKLSSKKSEEFVAIAWPDYLLGAIGNTRITDIASQLIDMRTRFFRGLGFRRIGSSRCFGYSPHLEHPSRGLAPEEDFDLPLASRAPPAKELEDFIKLISSINDAECLVQLRKMFDNASLQDMKWEVTDEVGNTLLHLVSTSSKVECTKWLMERNPNMCSIRNHEGDTPLESLETSIERRRTIREGHCSREDISDRFIGTDDATILCLIVLRNLASEQLSEAAFSRLKFGCTCDNCVGGFLSPRMRDILLSTAEETFDWLHTYCNDMDGESWYSENKEYFRYLPEPIMGKLMANKSMRTGFCKLWEYFGFCLRESQLPTEENILVMVRNASDWPPHCRNFLQRGGTISSVATALFWKAIGMEELWELDREELWELYREKKGELEDQTKDDLPTCRNDREFGFVSGMCGYERVPRIQLTTMSGRLIRH